MELVIERFAPAGRVVDGVQRPARRDGSRAIATFRPASLCLDAARPDVRASPHSVPPGQQHEEANDGHVAKSRRFEDVAGGQIAAVAATLPAERVAVLEERGQARDLQATATELLAELRR